MTNQRNETPEPLAGATIQQDLTVADLPPLPMPSCTYADHSYPAFTKAQMHEYATAALQAKDAEIARLKAVLDDASTLLKRTPRVCMEMYNHGDRTSFGFQAKAMVRAIDAMKGEAA